MKSFSFKIFTSCIFASILVSCGIKPKKNKSSFQDSGTLDLEVESKDGVETGDDCVESEKRYPVTYVDDISPLMQKYCLGCHYSAAAAGGWVLDSYIVSNPEGLDNKKAWSKVLNSIESGSMPPNGSGLEKAEKETLKNWITSDLPEKNAESCKEKVTDSLNILPKCDETLSSMSTSRIWRLTHQQWGNSTREILGVQHREEENFASDPSLYGFDNFSEALRISSLQANRYRTATRNLALETLDKAKITALRDLYSPGWGADPDVDRERFIRNFGLHLFRQPVFDRQVDDLVVVHEEGKKSGVGYRLLIESMLQSPYFLFRREIGDGRSTTQFETASLLSFTIWDEAPSLELIEMASKGNLIGENIETQIDKLIKSPKSERFFQRFFSSLLEVDKADEVSKNIDVFTEFSVPVAKEMQNEFKLMISYVLNQENSPLEKLFKDTPSFTNSILSPIHGYEGSVSDQLSEVNIEGRTSILTSPAFLTASGGAVDNNPFHRGQIIREKLLCMPLPAPPANIPPLESTGGIEIKNRRDLFSAHVSAPSCSGCHSLIDDLGFSLDNFDGIGKWQETIGDLKLDTRGSWTAFIDGKESFADGSEMSSQLATSEHLAQCITKQVFRFSLGRQEEKPDGCQIQNSYHDFKKSNFNLKILLKSIVGNPEIYQKKITTESTGNE